MTLDYKILGQLYYGPEVNQEPEIPGTSGYYTSTTDTPQQMFVAVTESPSGFALYSLDGINWSQGSIAGAFNSDWKKVANGNNKFVAVGTNSTGIAYSTDGINWTRTGSFSNRDVAFGDGKFVAVTDGSSSSYSTDGITWTSASMPSSQTWSGVGYGNGKFVAVTYGTAGAYSTDGINWTSTTLPSGTDWFDVAYGNGKYVAVGPSAGPGTGLAYSTDAVTWTAIAASPYDSWTDIAYGNGLFVATRLYGGFAISSDGVNWTTASSIGSFFLSISYGNGLFVTGDYQNNIYYSTDGATWTLVSVPTGFTPIFGFGAINIRTEVQISIGGQGTPGSYVEIVEPQVLYTVPAGTQTTVTLIFATNHDTIERSFDLAVVPSGEELALKHHIRWDMPVGASDFDLTNAKITMSAGDSLYVFPSTINKVGFTAFGVEKS